MKAQTTNTKTENAYLIVILFQLLTFATLGTIFVAYGISTFINLIINL